MPKPKDARPVAFFRLAPGDFEDLDATVERMMQMIEERSQERREAEEIPRAEDETEPDDDVTECTRL